MAGLAALLGPLRLKGPKAQRYFTEYAPWARQCGQAARYLITVYWENRWEQNTEELKKELGIWDGPPARWGNPLNEGQAAARLKEKHMVLMSTNVV